MGLPTGEFPPPIQDADQVVQVMEQIRRLAVQVSEWTTEELSERNFGPRIAGTLTSQAYTTHDAANAVAKDLERLMRDLGTAMLTVASVSGVLGSKVRACVIEPVQESRRGPKPAMGLHVND